MNVEDVVQAICAVYDPSTSNPDRMKCTQVIENFKDGPPEIVANTAFELITRNSSILRHTGWTLLEDLIRYKWNSIPPELCLALRSRICEAIDTLMQEENVESSARCVVAMMEHEWPQNWPELTSQLQQMCSRSFLHCAITFAIQRRLVENVATLASVSNMRRRRDMNSAMVESVDEFLIIALDKLDSCPLDRTNTATLLAARNIFGWLIEVCSCVTSNSMENRFIRIVDTVIRYLSTAEGNIYELAAQCLATLSARRREKNDQSIVISAFFRQEVFSAILTVTSLAADNSHFSEQHYHFLSKVWTEKHPPANFGTYISAIVAFFNHESLYLRHEACDVLVALSNHASFRDDEHLIQALRSVFSNFLRAFTKHGYPSQCPPTTASHYSQMDFEDDLEWHNFFIRFRSRLQVLIADNLRKHFDYLLSVCEKDVFQRILSDPHGVKEVEWDGMQKFVRSVIQVAYEKKIVDKKHEYLIAIRNALVTQMANMTDCDVLSELLSLHSPFLLSYGEDFDSFANYFSLLRKALIMSAGNKTLNRHVISLILRAVQCFPTYFKGHVTDVLALYADVDGVISKMQMAQLLQVSAVLSDMVDDESVQLKLLQIAVNSSVEHIRSIQWSFEDVSTFIKFNGFDVSPVVPKDLACNASRVELRQALTCIQGAVQQVNKSSPLACLLMPILPSFFKMSRCVLDLHTPEARQLLHPLSRDNITKIADFERQQIYCSVGENIEVITGRAITVDRDPIDIERQYVHDLNEQILTIISICVSKFPDKVFSLNDLPLLLLDMVASLESTPEFRLRCWIKKVWKSIICDCPRDKYGLIKEFFERIVGVMHLRLQNIWAEVSHIDYDSEPTEEQLFFEHMTCVLSREYISFLRSCYLHSDGDDKKAVTMSVLGDWLFDNRIGLSSVIMTVFSSLTFRDSTLVLRAAGFCKILVEKLANCYDDEVGVYMLVCSIRSLQLHGADEVTGTPIMGLVFHIYSVLVRAMISGDEVILEKQKKEMMRKLFNGIITLALGEQHKKPVYFRPLPPIEKRRRVVNEHDNFEDIALLFACEEV
ncbi:hypothetical protein COOONC_27183 [Cooperia oncophora]